jgi:rhodanese-related sulfurtransferase
MTITSSDLLGQIDAGNAPAILDVRSAHEFARGRVPGAVNRPFWAVLLGLARVPFNRDEPVVVYCQHGPRARIAARGLHRLGFRHVTYLKGDMAGWRRAGLREER